MATTEELKDQQFKQWTANAPGWDGMHERLEREMSSVTDWLCREAGLAPGMRVLDLACGSGHPAPQRREAGRAERQRAGDGYGAGNG